MKSIINRLSLILVFLFTAAMIFTAYYLYIFPDRLQKGSVLVEKETIQSLTPVFTELNIVVWSGLILGLIALMLQLFNNQGKNNEFVFEESDNEEKREDEIQQQQEERTADQNFSLKAYEKILQHEGELKRKLNKILWTVCKELEASQAAIYQTIEKEDKRFIELRATFAYSVPDSQVISFEFGEGLAGQVAKEGRVFNITDVPEGYIKVLSGLGNASPNHLIILPIANENNVMGVMEIASFKAFDKETEKFLKELTALTALKISEEEKIESVKEEQQNQ